MWLGVLFKIQPKEGIRRNLLERFCLNIIFDFHMDFCYHELFKNFLNFVTLGVRFMTSGSLSHRTT